MNINGKAYRTIWLGDGRLVGGDHRPDPAAARAGVRHARRRWRTRPRAIQTMQVRGAPLIGATAAYGVCLALREDASDEALDRAIALLAKQRPTAINLRWALDEMRDAVRNLPRDKRARRRLRARRRDLRRRRRDQPRASASTALKLIEAIAAAQEAGRARQHPDPLQRRLARLRRPRHGARAHLRGARPRHRRCMSGSTRRGRATRARR